MTWERLQKVSGYFAKAGDHYKLKGKKSSGTEEEHRKTIAAAEALRKHVGISWIRRKVHMSLDEFAESLVQTHVAVDEAEAKKILPDFNGISIALYDGFASDRQLLFKEGERDGERIMQIKYETDAFGGGAV